jgi:type I restriction enzyme M protein
LEHFEEFFKLLPEKATSERSWLIPIEEIKAKNFELKAVNPNRKGTEDNRTPEELLSIIESRAAEITKVLMTLRNRGI